MMTLFIWCWTGDYGLIWPLCWGLCRWGGLLILNELDRFGEPQLQSLDERTQPVLQ